MSLLLIIAFAIAAFIILVIISYKFRDAFFLFEGICYIFDGIGHILCEIGDTVDIDIGDD